MQTFIKNSLLLFCLFSTPCLQAQDVVQCRKIVDLAIEAVNTQSPALLDSHLSENFSTGGQTGQIAKTILTQLITQLNETVVESEEIKQEKTSNGLELQYNFQYKMLGEKQARFLFNEQNKIVELDLLKFEVKTLEPKKQVKKNTKDLIEIPFEMAGNLISTKVEVDGIEQNFIIDTGAPITILNSKYLQKKEGSRKSISTTKGVGGNISGMDIDTVKFLNFGGIQLENQGLLSFDISHLEEELESPIHGLIGFDLIKDYDLLFDYESKKITLIKPELFSDFKSKSLTGKEVTRIPLEMQNHIPVIEATVKNQTLKLGIDSGAETNLLDDDLFPSFKKYLKNISTDTLSGADKLRKKVQKGQLKKVTIGGKIFKKMSTVFSDIAHLNESYKIKLDGLVGYEFLSRQLTLISFERKEVLIFE